MEKITKIGLVLKPGLEEDSREVKKVIDILRKYNLTRVDEGFEVLVTLGGDGTYLGAAKRNIDVEVPILGIHLGRMGFLAEADFDEIEEMVERLASGKYMVKERMVLEVEIDNRIVSAINEVVIRGKKATSFVGLKVFIGGEYVNSYLGDGLIVATPTGSTAYNLSAGGPIVYPYSENYVLTPIASHALSQRSLVLPTTMDDVEIKFEDRELVAVIDGQDEIDLSELSKIVIRKRKVGVKSICRNELDFFRVLKTKLGWGDDRV